MTYRIPDALEEKDITLTNGEHRAWELHILYGARYAYDDFDQNGLQDAAVLLIENTGGNQYWDSIAFLMSDGQRLVHRATIYLDDMAMIHAFRARNGRVFVDMQVHQPGDSHGGPSKHVKEWYRYPGPNVFASRMGTYVFGELEDGIRGEPG